MDTNRKHAYDQILATIKNSPMKSVEFEGNTYNFKLDYMLPFGECHYARIFSKLIYLKECLGIIRPGDTLLETTSGSGGRAAAAVATALGYKMVIGLPAGGEHAREAGIVKAGAELCLTSAEAYVNGFPEFIRKYLADHPNAKYLNHSMGDIFGRGNSINVAAINAFRPFISEVIEYGLAPDVVICPLGNGTTALPMTTDFKSMFPKVRVIGFESVSSAYAHRVFYPGKYERIFGIVPGAAPRHDLPGTMPAATAFTFPALTATIPMLDAVGLVTSDQVNRGFKETYGFLPAERSDWVAKWDDDKSSELSEFGRTGKAGFAIAKLYARKHGLTNANFLIPVFDASWHYDH